MSRPSVRTTAVIALLLVVVSACGGGRRTEDPTSTSPATGTESSVPQFGDLESPCGPGTPSGAPDQAVTADTVTIGFGDDAGYQGSPGYGHEAADAVRAMIDWCNEQGGINGRTVVGNYYDGKITELNNAMSEACTQVFMMVGEFYGLPESAEETRIRCGLPAVPSIVSGGDLAMAPLVVAPVPQPIDSFNVGAAAEIAEAFPDEVKKAAIMTPVFPAITDYVQRFQRTVPTVGWEFIGCDQTYPITGVADYRPYLQKLKDCGAEVVFSLDVQQGMQNILDAAAQLDYQPIWLQAASVYAESFAAWNTSGYGDRMYFGNPMVPIDYTPEGSANAAYNEIVTANGGDIAYSGQVSTSAFLLWATAAKACGNDLTRDCVMTQLHGIHEWTAGGMSAPQDPGANMIDDCVQVMKLEGTRFVQWQPTDEGQFACDPSWAVAVDPPTDSWGRLGIGSDRVATNVTGG